MMKQNARGETKVWLLSPNHLRISKMVRQNYDNIRARDKIKNQRQKLSILDQRKSLLGDFLKTWENDFMRYVNILSY